MFEHVLPFAKPWEARAFAIAHVLADRGLFSWDEFQAALIAETAEQPERAECDDPPDPISSRHVLNLPWPTCLVYLSEYHRQRIRARQ